MSGCSIVFSFKVTNCDLKKSLKRDCEVCIMENGRIFQQLIPEIVKIYGDLLVSIILYGSVARGTQTDESDIDIALMLRSEENADMKERMTDIIVDLELEHNKVLSILRIDYEKFKIWEDTMPFYKNMKKDGVVLWQAA